MFALEDPLPPPSEEKGVKASNGGWWSRFLENPEQLGAAEAAPFFAVVPGRCGSGPPPGPATSWEQSRKSICLHISDASLRIFSHMSHDATRRGNHPHDASSTYIFCTIFYASLYTTNLQNTLSPDTRYTMRYTMRHHVRDAKMRPRCDPYMERCVEMGFAQDFGKSGRGPRSLRGSPKKPKNGSVSPWPHRESPAGWTQSVYWQSG